MKVVVTGTRGFPDVQGGVEKHCEKLYTHLAERGCEIIVFTRKPYVSPGINKYKGITLIPVNCPRNKFLEAFVHTLKCIFKAWRLKCDILHIHAIGPSFFTPLARILGMTVVVTTHGPDYKREKWSLPAKVFLEFCEKMGMTFANEIIAISNNIAEDIKKKYIRNPVIIPNGVEIPMLANTEHILEKYELQKMKYILEVGRIVPEKGCHDLIEAFVKGKFKDVKLVIAGDADHHDKYSNELKTKASQLSNVVLTGFLTEQPLQELYSHAALFVLPSYYEGLPIALLEAMSYGLSCIASGIPANRNVPLDEKRFFKEGDIKSIVSHIEDFLSKEWDEKDREEQVRMIYALYNWEKIADETLEVYKSIVSRGMDTKISEKGITR